MEIPVAQISIQLSSIGGICSTVQPRSIDCDIETAAILADRVHVHQNCAPKTTVFKTCELPKFKTMLSFFRFL